MGKTITIQIQIDRGMAEAYLGTPPRFTQDEINEITEYVGIVREQFDHYGYTRCQAWLDQEALPC